MECEGIYIDAIGEDDGQSSIDIFGMEFTVLLPGIRAILASHSQSSRLNRKFLAPGLDILLHLFSGELLTLFHGLPLVGDGIPVFIHKRCVAFCQRSTVEGQCDETAEILCLVLCGKHPVVTLVGPERNQLAAFVQQQHTKLPGCGSFDRFLEKDPDMRSLSGTGSFHKAVDSQLGADHPQGFSFLPRLGWIRGFAVSVKVKNQKPAGPIRMQWIDSNRI